MHFLARKQVAVPNCIRNSSKPAMFDISARYTQASLLVKSVLQDYASFL